MTQARILIVPGRGNSEPGHWQSIIETRLPGTLRVQQADWDAPKLDAWSKNIDRAVRACPYPPLLVAHSFGCLAAAHAQIELCTPVGATLFVAPADPERFGLPCSIFSETLAHPGIVVASDNDPWLSRDKAEALAAEWGLECINLGSAGHINVASGFGRWPFGETITTSMRNELTRDKRSQTFNPRQQVAARHACRPH